jgi:TRAP-type C4-dicarboxylate transport system substrate-binding protein
VKSKKMRYCFSRVCDVGLALSLVSLRDDDASTDTTGGVSHTDTTAATLYRHFCAGYNGGNGGDDLGDFEFSLSMHDPLTSNNGQFYQAWADSISEATDGHVKITILPQWFIGCRRRCGRAVETGAVDIGWVFHFRSTLASSPDRCHHHSHDRFW